MKIQHYAREDEKMNMNANTENNRGWGNHVVSPHETVQQTKPQTHIH